ncbi:family 16 glycosylhydrolase [candidate division KSB1 bacterium]|nr:family 16 glycosylhydrolase [candidate division KSB1 bacterium]
MKIKSAILIISLISPFHQSIARAYKGAELRSRESFLYGRFEVRYKSSAGSGQTSTFFLYNDNYPNTPWNEIDIEILGRYTDDVQFNPITPGRINHVSHQFVDFNPATDFHAYTVEWTPTYVAWFIDGIERHRQTGEHIEALNVSQKIMMNIWNPAYTDWVGECSDKMLPFFAYYDYVSYAAYTPGAGDVGTDHNFTLQWKDDFDMWDTSRWQKATHTFDGNNCDFIPENCVFHDGMMILCLTSETEIGYVDEQAPWVMWARLQDDQVVVHFSEQLNRSTAENAANYRISGISIESAVLQADLQTVILITSGMGTAVPSSVVVIGVEDDAPGSNRLIGQSAKIITNAPLTFPVKINTGGPEHEAYLSDQPWTSDVMYGFSEGQTAVYPTGLEITGTDNDRVYQSDRYGLTKYNVCVPNGWYTVTLHMSEKYFNDAGKRVFDVYVEGQLIANRVDVIAEVGKNAAYDVVANNVNVTDHMLDVHFCSVMDQPLLNGIIVEPVETRLNQFEHNVPATFYLSQNFPNPFNATTRIDYGLAAASNVDLTIFDITGKKIQTLINQPQVAGQHRILWDAHVPSGVYLFKLDASTNQLTFSEIKRMVLLK